MKKWQYGSGGDPFVPRISLHDGLDIIIVFTNYQGKTIMKEIFGLTNQLLDVISFSTSAYCAIDRIDFILNFDTEHQIPPTGDLSLITEIDPEPYVPRTINQKIFTDTFQICNGFNAKDRDRFFRALAWFRQSFLEIHTVFEFLSLWIALETLNPLISDNIPKVNTNKWENKWRGLLSVFSSKVRVTKFDEIELDRNNLVHSLGEISNDTVTNLTNYFQPMTEAFYYGANLILGLNQSLVNDLAKKRRLKCFQIKSQMLRGKFEDLTYGLDSLLYHYPELKVKQGEKKYLVNKKGYPGITYNFLDLDEQLNNIKFVPKARLIEKSNGESIEVEGFKNFDQFPEP